MLENAIQEKSIGCDIAFVLRPSEFGEFLPFPEMILTAYLKERGFKAVIIDGNPIIKHSIKITDEVYRTYFEFVKNGLLKCKPRFIGLGTFTSDYDFVISFSQEIKKYLDAKIIVGNVQATIMPQDFIFPGSPVDLVVRGEGELTLTELLQLPDLSVDKLKEVKGICFLDMISQQSVLTEKRELIRDLSILPIPAYESIDMKFYTRPRKRVIGYAYYSVVPIYTGRGCPFRCRFCASGTVWGERSIRYISVDRSIAEIKLLINTYHVDAIYVLDDTFTINKSRVMEFCQKIKPLNVVWSAQTRVNCVDEEMVKTMKEAGCVQLTFGVETGSQKLLNLMQKGSTVEQEKRAFEICRKYGMRTFANMMFNLPEEEEDDVKQSYEIYRCLKPDDFGVGLTVAYPGTDIYEQYFPKKLKKEEYYLLAEARGYGQGRFRLCRHNLSFNDLLVDFRMDLKIQHLLPLFIRILFTSDYWIMIFRSRRKFEYLVEIAKDIPTGLMRSLGILAYNLAELLPNFARNWVVNIATDYGKKYGN